jgi:hypothetical protein
MIHIFKRVAVRSHACFCHHLLAAAFSLFICCSLLLSPSRCRLPRGSLLHDFSMFILLFCCASFFVLAAALFPLFDSVVLMLLSPDLLPSPYCCCMIILLNCCFLKLVLLGFSLFTLLFSCAAFLLFAAA